MRCESCFLGLDHEHVAEPTTEPDYASQLAEECYPVSSHASLEMCIRRALKRAAEVAEAAQLKPVPSDDFVNTHNCGVYSAVDAIRKLGGR